MIIYRDPTARNILYINKQLGTVIPGIPKMIIKFMARPKNAFLATKQKPIIMDPLLTDDSIEALHTFRCLIEEPHNYVSPGFQ